MSNRETSDLRVIIITAADTKYFVYANEMIQSVRYSGYNIDIGFMDLGLVAQDREALSRFDVSIVEPRTSFDTSALANAGPENLGYLARPFLRENFPGYDLYVWMDADAWLQDKSGLIDLISRAADAGGAFVPEREKAYRLWPWLLGWRAKHFVKGYGLLRGAFLWTKPHINNGVFAMRADAPHWKSWQQHYQRAINRTGLAAPHDQFGLNAAVYLDGHASAFLPASYNWICHLAAPVWDKTRGVFCIPYAPFDPIAIMHLAGPAKTATLDIRTTDGGTRQTNLRYKTEYRTTR